MSHLPEVDSQPAVPSPPLSPDDALPPVEPPAAGFIVKLFVVPLMIVAVVAGLILLVNMLTNQGDNREDMVKAIANDAPNSWQVAHDLTILIQQDEDLRRDGALAGQLGQVLLDKLKEPSAQSGLKQDEIDRRIRLRMYLCQALGEFEVLEALPPLLYAASSQTAEGEQEVRRAALRAIALLAHNVRKNDQSLEQPEVLDLLLAASREREGSQRSDLIREPAAFALGVLGGEQAIERLKDMLEDPAPNVAYNAATGLARHGVSECLPKLAEMIDPEQVAGLEQEQNERDRFGKKWSIHFNAIQAAEQFAAKNPSADMSLLVAPLERMLAEDDVPSAVETKGRGLLLVIEER